MSPPGPGRQRINQRLHFGKEAGQVEPVRHGMVDVHGQGHQQLSALRFFKYNEKDSAWIDEPYLFLPVEGDRRSYVLYAEWHPGEKYKFEADSNAVVSILGKLSTAIKKDPSLLRQT